MTKKQLSTNSDNVTLWIGKDLKDAWNKGSSASLGQFVRGKMLEYLQEKNIPVNVKDPDLIMLVRCPYCRFEQNTTALKFVTCYKCGKKYRHFPKNIPSRIVKIVKGDIHLLHKKMGVRNVL